jgi:hypothetical protein
MNDLQLNGEVHRYPEGYAVGKSVRLLIRKVYNEQQNRHTYKKFGTLDKFEDINLYLTREWWGIKYTVGHESLGVL